MNGYEYNPWEALRHDAAEGYVGARVRTAPENWALVDRDLNMLAELGIVALRRAIVRAIGDGAFGDALKVIAVQTPDDFKVLGGECLVGGILVNTETVASFAAKTQPLSRVAQGERTDYVYLDVWLQQQDVDQSSCYYNIGGQSVHISDRLQVQSMVRVSEGQAPQKPLESGDGYWHWHLPLAHITRRAKQFQILAEDITDQRPQLPSLLEVAKKLDTDLQAAIERLRIEKADRTAVDASLNTKADKTAMDTALSAKANASDVNIALNAKADKTAMDTALNAKANTSDVYAALNAKADKTAMDNALSAKANTSDVNNALNAKADKTAISAGISTASIATNGLSIQDKPITAKHIEILEKLWNRLAPTISGISPSPVREDDNFSIMGTNFDAGELSVTWGEEPWIPLSRSATQLDFKAPKTNGTIEKELEIKNDFGAVRMPFVIEGRAPVITQIIPNTVSSTGSFGISGKNLLEIGLIRAQVGNQKTLTLSVLSVDPSGTHLQVRALKPPASTFTGVIFLVTPYGTAFSQDTITIEGIEA